MNVIKRILEALLNNFGACKAESLISISCVYQIPERDMVSKILLFTTTWLTYQSGYFHLKTTSSKLILLASFNGDSPCPKVVSTILASLILNSGRSPSK